MENLHDVRELCAREKLLTYGANHLSDSELLAVLISSGTREKSCLQLAEELLKTFGNIRAIFNASLDAFKKVKGLGQVRFTQLQAARELCQRNDFISLQKEGPLTSFNQTSAYFKRKLRDKKNETFAVLFLDTQFRVLSFEELFSGTINATYVHLRPLIERALTLNAAGVILGHNHPSGISDPSNHDVELTKCISETLKVLDVELLDHLVIGDNEVTSILHQTKWTCY